MPFSFPASPAVGQQSTQNGRVYQWTGSAWEIVATGVSIDGSQITSGTIATARLGSGAASGTTFLRGDQLWSAITPSDIGARAAISSVSITGAGTTTLSASAGQTYQKYLVTVSVAVSTYVANVVLDQAGRTAGDVVEINFSMPGQTTSGAYSIVQVFTGSASGSPVLQVPNEAWPSTFAARFYYNGSSWVFDSGNTDIQLPWHVASAARIAQAVIANHSSSTTVNSANAFATDNVGGAQISTSASTANSSAHLRGTINPVATVAGQRILTSNMFYSPFAVSLHACANLSSASSTSVCRYGVYQAYQNITAPSAGATVGQATTPCIGIEIRNNGAFFGFLYEGSTPTFQTYSLGFTLGDLGGGQGGMLLPVDFYFSPHGVAEWWVNRTSRLRLTGLTFPISSAQNYVVSQASASNGATAAAIYFNIQRVGIYQV